MAIGWESSHDNHYVVESIKRCETCQIVHEIGGLGCFNGRESNGLLFSSLRDVTCETCQKCKTETIIYPEMLQLLSIPQGIWGGRCRQYYLYTISDRIKRCWYNPRIKAKCFLLLCFVFQYYDHYYHILTQTFNHYISKGPTMKTILLFYMLSSNEPITSICILICNAPS